MGSPARTSAPGLDGLTPAHTRGHSAGRCAQASSSVPVARVLKGTQGYNQGTQEYSRELGSLGTPWLAGEQQVPVSRVLTGTLRVLTGTLRVLKGTLRVHSLGTLQVSSKYRPMKVVAVRDPEALSEVRPLGSGLRVLVSTAGVP